MTGEKGYTAIEKLLIGDNGADVNAITENRDTPLHWATYNRHAMVTHPLLENGAKILAKALDNKIPIDLAKEGHKELIAILEETAREQEQDKQSENTKDDTKLSSDATKSGTVTTAPSEDPAETTQGDKVKTNDNKLPAENARESEGTDMVPMLEETSREPQQEGTD